MAGENGFGYDPIFIPEKHNSTFGELDESIKKATSHRANALQLVAQRILHLNAN